MPEMWTAFLNLPPIAQVAFVASCAFFGSLCGLLLLIHGRRAWYAWRREVWLRRYLAEADPGPFGMYVCDEGHRLPTMPGQHFDACPVCQKERLRLNGLVEVRRERLQ